VEKCAKKKRNVRGRQSLEIEGVKMIPGSGGKGPFKARSTKIGRER